MQRSLKTWWGAWYVRPQYLQRKNIEKEQCTNLIATGGRVFISPWSFQTKKDSFRSTGLLARCLTNNLLHRNKGWVCPNVGCTNSTPHVLSDPNLGADSARWVRFAFSAMLIVHVSNSLQFSSYYKYTECLKLQGLATSSNTCFDAAMDLAQNACGYPVAAAAPPCPKEASLREFQWYGPTWHSLYTSLWEFVARKILWKYTPDCTRTFCVDSENIEISWKFFAVWDSMPMPMVPVSSSSVQQHSTNKPQQNWWTKKLCKISCPTRSSCILHIHGRVRGHALQTSFLFKKKWCKKLIVLCWHANGSHSPIQHVLGSGEDGMATDWLAQCYLSMSGSGRLKRLSRHWPHVSTRVWWLVWSVMEAIKNKLQNTSHRVS